MQPPSEQELRTSLAALADSRHPFLIGVRHHAPSMAAIMEAILDAAAPELVLVELPEDFAQWLPWLGDPKLVAPVALAAVGKDEQLAFYPFADFSPELAAIRWAVSRGVDVQPFDLPCGVRVEQAERSLAGDRVGITSRMQSRFRASDFESLWDRLVEVRSHTTNAEATRRAALYAGWMLRWDAQEEVAVRDLMRETHMRSRIEESGGYEGKNVACVVGAFHAPALLAEPQLFQPVEVPEVEAPLDTAMMPYTFDLLDSRSGYPAGIRDPRWQQAVYQATRQSMSMEEVVVKTVVEICRRLRQQGHAGSVPDGIAAASMAIELARLRGLRAPGRQELLEGITTSLSQADIMGRGRVLARVLEDVMVGDFRGNLPPGAPLRGLQKDVHETMEALSLPTDERKTMRLTPWTSDLDRRRHLFLERLSVCGIPYATPRFEATDQNSLAWDVEWGPISDAMLAARSVDGVTLAQATRGRLTNFRRRAAQEDEYRGAVILTFVQDCARAGFEDLLESSLDDLRTTFLEDASPAQILSAMQLVGRLESGAFLGASTQDVSGLIDIFFEAAIRGLDGLAGSSADEDARALISLVLELVQGENNTGAGRLGWVVEAFVSDGAPLMQGAGLAAARILNVAIADDLGPWLQGWVEAHDDILARKELALRLRGLLIGAGPILAADEAALDTLIRTVENMSDDDFLLRLPALRKAFGVLSSSDRSRWADKIAGAAQVNAAHFQRSLTLTVDPDQVAHNLAADRRAHQSAVALFGEVELPGSPDNPSTDDSPIDRRLSGPQTIVRATDDDSAPDHEFDTITRWQLILGQEVDKSSSRAPMLKRALDELYGFERGEGSQQVSGDGGGKEDAYPGVREWIEDIVAHFGESIREEVLAAAADMGTPAALLEMDGTKVQPSVELLQTILSLRGGLSEGQMAGLRPMIRRIVEELAKALSDTMRPSLTGLNTQRTTRRKTDRLDLRRTLRANLDKAHRDSDGVLRIVPEDLYFSARSRRAMTWHVTVLVDVSGSMEPSVIYSAIVGTILHKVPALTVRFATFHTEVVDLSNLIDDPLDLLLEIEVGGGTHIAKALQWAREGLHTPSRTIVLVVSDFEEGFSLSGLLGQTRALVETGAHVLGLAALDDRGAPRYSQAIAASLAAAGMPVAALSPDQLAGWIQEKIRG